MDVVITYLYGSLNTNIYIKISEEFKIPKAFKLKDHICVQSSYNSPCMDWNNLDARGTIL